LPTIATNGLSRDDPDLMAPSPNSNVSAPIPQKAKPPRPIAASEKSHIFNPRVNARKGHATNPDAFNAKGRSGEGEAGPS